MIVDDEPEAVELVRYSLEQAGFEVVSAADGVEALNNAQRLQLQLIILDVLMPEMDGLEVCRLLRRDPVTAAIPIVMLTAKASENDRVRGLELGADDYMVKPFSGRELVLRIKKLLERAKQKLVVGDLVIDLPRNEVAWKDREILLTSSEFKLLTMLVEYPGRVLSRDVLLRKISSREVAVDSRTLDMHIYRLREKLGEAGQCLDTVWGVGYRFVAR